MKNKPLKEEGVADRGPTASYAHEINNPLAVIVANLDYVVERLGSGQPNLETCVRDVRPPLDAIRAAADRIRFVVRHMVANLPPAALASAQSSAGSQHGATEGEPTRATDPPTSGTASRVARILIIDDEVALGAALRRSLRDYDVVALANAREALTRISGGERFDFILCDVMMPDLTGPGFYEQLVLLAPEQAERVVFMTGGTTAVETEDFLSTTACRVLQKPVEVGGLRGLIEDRLAGA